MHLQAARCMAGMMPGKGPDGLWTYPPSGKVLEKAGLRTIDAYIKARRDTILHFIINRPIHTLCKDAERQRSTSHRQYWWQQQMDLEEESSGDSTNYTEEEAHSEDDDRA